MSYNYTKIQTSYVVSVITASVLVAGAYFLSRKRKARIPTEWKEVGKLKKLYLYPLKSGKRIDLENAECTSVGIMEAEKFDKSFRLRDRSFVVYSSQNNEFKTARTYPKLLLIELDSTDINYVTINAPNMRTLFVRIPSKDKQVKINQFRGEEILGLDCGDEAAQWISQYLLEKDEGMRFAYNDASQRRRVEKLYKDYFDYYKNFGNDATGLFSDIGSALLLNKSSIDDLNRRLDKDSVVSHTNFRPNFLIDGPDLKAYEEDKWDWIKIGDIVLRNVMECTRCVLTTIDPDTIIRNQKMEPLKTLKTYRIGDGPSKSSPVMGAFLKFYTTGEIRVGDTVYINTK